MPAKIVVFDVETTGLTGQDRVVSLGAIMFDTTSISEGTANCRHLHLAFDPGRRSHRRAEAVHGYDDWTLRHQETFADRAEEIRNFETLIF